MASAVQRKRVLAHITCTPIHTLSSCGLYHYHSYTSLHFNASDSILCDTFQCPLNEAHISTSSSSIYNVNDFIKSVILDAALNPWHSLPQLVMNPALAKSVLILCLFSFLKAMQLYIYIV